MNLHQIWHWLDQTGIESGFVQWNHCSTIDGFTFGYQIQDLVRSTQLYQAGLMLDFGFIDFPEQTSLRCLLVLRLPDSSLPDNHIFLDLQNIVIGIYWETDNLDS